MKKTILLSSLFAVGAAFAGEVTNANAIAALDLEVTNTPAQTLVAVPFEGFEAGGKVKVNDIVKTSNLGNGSKLYVPNAEGTYNTWTLSDGGWVPADQVVIGKDGTPDEKEGVDSNDVEVDRGSAFWIQPAATGTIFLLGQKSEAAGSSTVKPNAWNMIGNASPEEKEIGTEFAAASFDQIVVQVDGKLRYYTYKYEKGWRYQNAEGTWISASPRIAAGQGLWYKSAVPAPEGETVRTIAW